MQVVHMDSGLGNQMLDYAEYLAIKKSNPDKEVLIENLIYELPKEEGMFSQWNGYELERIFGIKVPNVKEKFNEKEWNTIIEKVHNSYFWEQNWNFAPTVVEALADAGITLEDRIGDSRVFDDNTVKSRIRKLITRFFATRIGYHVKRMLRTFFRERLITKNQRTYNPFQKYPDNTFVGHSLCFRFKGYHYEDIKDEVEKAFIFPKIVDHKNLEALKKISSVNSVAIHARRSDLLSVNGYCYKYGFFRRAVKYIKRHVEHPVFFFFCDELSDGWCQENPRVFGIDFKKDEVHFVDWNSGEESYRDMQLMSQCKHNIFTESSFGLWGALLNKNPDKITCAPEATMNARKTF